MKPDQDAVGVRDDLIERLNARYTAEPVPPCPVCGAALGLARAGGGEATVYACGDHKPFDHAHYARSRFTQYRPGDSDVLALLSRLEKAQGERGQLDEPLIERLAYEASVWAKDPAHNIGADQPSLVFARRFAFLLQQATRHD